MRTSKFKWLRLGLVLLVGMLVLAPMSKAQPVQAQQNGPRVGIVCTTAASPNPTFNLTAQTGYIVLADGNTMFMWGYALDGQSFQHPSPVLCVNQGDTVTVILKNNLPEDAVSIMFPGQDEVLVNGLPAQPQFDGGGNLISMTNTAAPAGGTVTYSFVASHPGTFIYESGTDPKKQVQMGLFGALIVRPDLNNFAVSGFANNLTSDAFVMTDTLTSFAGKDYLIGGLLSNTTDGASCTITAVATDSLTCASGLAGGSLNTWNLGDAYTAAANPAAKFGYNRADSQFTPAEEFLVLLSEIDPYQHQAAEQGKAYYDANYDINAYHTHYWLLNGRTFPDSIADNFASWLPDQPYGALALMHPYNTDPNAGPAYHPYPAMVRYLNVGTEDIPFHPHGNNGTVIGRDGNPLEGDLGEDLSFEKFAINIGPGQTWDVLSKWYDAEHYDEVTNPVPVTIPDVANQTIGMFWSGSPYLGKMGPLPPGVSTLNQCGEYYIISHNHALFQLDAWGMTMAGQITYLRIDPPLGPNNICPPTP